MKLWYVAVVALLPSVAFSQTVLPPPSEAANQPSPSSTHAAWLIGKVTVEGGSAPPDPVSVVMRCGNQERARAFSSSNGDFSVMFTPDEQSLQTSSNGRQFSFGNGSGCELSVDSADYISKSLPLFGQMAGDINKVGTIVLYPRTTAGEATVSVTSLAAPEKAKKAFEKGQEKERKGKLQAACDFFRRAVEAYPQYAIAWLELGRAQIRQNDFNSAQQSFNHATDHDSRLIAGYEGLAEVALRQDNWKDLAESTGKILAMSPDADAKIWFLNSAANFNLGDTKRAETGVVRGLHLDRAHRVPQLEFLYGIILARRAAYADSTQHLETYLRLAPKDENAAQAQKIVDQIQRLAASAKAAVAAKP